MEGSGVGGSGGQYVLLNNTEIEAVIKSNLVLLNHLSIPVNLKTLPS